MKTFYEYMKGKYLWGSTYIDEWDPDVQKFTFKMKQAPANGRRIIQVRKRSIKETLNIIKTHNKNLYKNLLDNYPEYII